MDIPNTQQEAWKRWRPDDNIQNDADGTGSDHRRVGQPVNLQSSN